MDSPYAYAAPVQASLGAPLLAPPLVPAAVATMPAPTKKVQARPGTGPKKPKRPKTAYHFFFDAERKAALDAAPDRDKVDNNMLSRQLGQRWKAMDANARRPWDELAKGAKEDYDEAVRLFEAQGGRMHDVTPTKPLSAYMLYFRAKHQAQKPDEKVTDFAKVTGAEWKALSDQDKQPFHESAKKQRDIYDNQVAFCAKSCDQLIGEKFLDGRPSVMAFARVALFDNGTAAENADEARAAYHVVYDDQSRGQETLSLGELKARVCGDERAAKRAAARVDAVQKKRKAIPPPPMYAVPVDKKPKKAPKPRGRAPKNASGQPATWDSDRGEWIGVVKKPVQKFPKPRGPAPKNASGQPATWDSDRGEWIDVVKKPVQKFPKPCGREPYNAQGVPATWDSDRGEWIGVVKKPVQKFPKPQGPAPKNALGAPATWDSERGEWTGLKCSAPAPEATRGSARNQGVEASPIDANAGHTDKKGASRRDGTELDWKNSTPDDPTKNLYEVLEDAVVALDDEDCLFASRRDEAGELIQRLKRSHPRSFPSPDVDYSDTFEQKVYQIREALHGKHDAPYSPYSCPGMAQFVPEFQKMASVECVAVGSVAVATYGCIPFFVLALVAMYGLCFLTLHVPSFERATRIVKANFREAAAGLMSTIAVCLGGRPDYEGRWSGTNMTPRTVPLFLFKYVLLKQLGLAGDTATYHRQTFMARASGVGLRLPVYVMIYSLNVYMFCVRAYPAVYQLAADCFFGRMAAGLRPLWMATNALFEGEGTVGHDFLRWSYISGAELREVVGLMGPGGRARIRIRKRLGKVLEYVWEGTSWPALERSFFVFYNAARHELDGIGTTPAAASLRLWSLRGKKSVGDDQAIYGAPFDFSVRVYVDGFWKWVRGGRKLDGDEYELAAAKVLNDAQEVRLEGKEFVVEDHAGPHFELWPGDKGLRARLLGLRKYADHAYYLFHVFILPAVIVAVWLHQDSDFERAVAKAEAEAKAEQVAGVAAGRALRAANGQAAVSERRCAGGQRGRTGTNKGVASVKALFAGIAAGLVQGCKDLAAAARASSYDALLTRARNDHVRICAPMFARVRATHPLERAVQLGDVEFDAYLLIALRRRLYSFDRPTKARALKEIRRIEESCLGEGDLSRLPRVGMPQPMSF